MCKIFSTYFVRYDHSINPKTLVIRLIRILKKFFVFFCFLRFEYYSISEHSAIYATRQVLDSTRFYCCIYA